jgi:hypothetical protein
MGTGEHCPTAGRDAGGLFAGSGVNVGTIQPFSSASQTFESPAGTSIVYLAARYSFHRVDPYWRVGVFAGDGTMLHGCEPAAHEPGCYFHSGSIGGTSDWGFTPGEVRRVYVQTTCGAAGGCSSNTAAPSGDRGGIRLYSGMVRVHDESTPSVWDVGDGALSNGAWQSGSPHVGFAASDNVGIRRNRLYVDGRLLQDDGRDCDFTRRVPCFDVTYGRYTVNTAALSDGDHEVKVEVVDAAGNPGALVERFRSDNTAPDAPRGVAVEGGDGWRQANRFRVSWTNPASASPIVRANYELCNVKNGACTTGVRDGGGIHAADLSVPEPGHYTLRLWLQDEAGNVNGANRSEAVRLRFDNVPPGEAWPEKRNGWLNADEAKNFDEPIRLRDGEFVPVSGLAGYSITTDGTDPDGTIDVPGGVYRIAELREGITTIKARAISNSGVPSARVGSTTIQVDKSKPVVDAPGAPSPEKWHREPVTLRLVGTDQPQLSGMGPAGENQPLEDGAFVTYRLDGNAPQFVRGGEASLTVEDDGEHTVNYQAVDLAGNRSAERSLRLRVDRTAPEVVVFEAPDDRDPRRVAVAVADRTSGIATGGLEIRLVTSSGPWQEVPSTLEGNRLTAAIDDAARERGVYELRARVVDRAGNEAVGDRRRDGSPARIDTRPLAPPPADPGTPRTPGPATADGETPRPAPVDAEALRSDSKLVAALVRRTAPKPKPCAKKQRKRKRCPKPTAVIPTEELVGALQVPFGKQAIARGRLTTPGGAPIGDAVVDVLGRSAVPGSEFTRIAATRTDAAGGFRYVVPRGVSRTIRFQYGGSPYVRGSEADLSVAVTAAATIKVSPRAVANGKSVTFRGRLRGTPIPRGGKVLDLQAFYRRKWRTFATPRANAKGAWRYRYRFEATRGRVKYRFRVKVRPESAYPFALGYSPEVNVTVRGR